jgi:hypothetical protein
VTPRAIELRLGPGEPPCRCEPSPRFGISPPSCSYSAYFPLCTNWLGWAQRGSHARPLVPPRAWPRVGTARLHRGAAGGASPTAGAGRHRSDERLIDRFVLSYRDRTRRLPGRPARLSRGGAPQPHRGLHAPAGAGCRSRATVTRRLATLAGFYRYAVQEGALRHSPATHVRRPSVARHSQTLGLDREEAVRFLAAAQAASARHYLRLGGVRIGAALPHPRGPTRSAFGFLRRAGRHTCPQPVQR